METLRKPFQGVLNILSFNRHFYMYGLLVLAALLIVAFVLKLKPLVTSIILGGFSYGLVIPLVVSAYVYDYSGYYKLGWLNYLALPINPETVVNIHAGFDETSHLIMQKFPASMLKVFDFYDPTYHTEVAIKRARKAFPLYPGTEVIKTSALPLKDHSVDIVFLLSAVHEIRDHREKVQFLKGVRRVLKPSGKVVIVEHLRDVPNFFAFTIGFTHFFSPKTWRNAFSQGGLTLIQEKKFTPFMSIFELKSNDLSA